MDVMEAVRQRRSIRLFEDSPIPTDDLHRLLDAAVLAPSPQNGQPWRFHVAVGQARERVNEVLAQSTVHLTEYLEMLQGEELEAAERFYATLGGAPVVIAVSLPNYEDETERTNALISAGAAMENMLLVATGLGLGSCIITFPFWVADQLVDVFEIPEDRGVVTLVLLGEPAEHPSAPRRQQDLASVLD